MLSCNKWISRWWMGMLLHSENFMMTCYSIQQGILSSWFSFRPKHSIKFAWLYQAWLDSEVVNNLFDWSELETCVPIPIDLPCRSSVTFIITISNGVPISLCIIHIIQGYIQIKEMQHVYYRQHHHPHAWILLQWVSQPCWSVFWYPVRLNQSKNQFIC